MVLLLTEVVTGGGSVCLKICVCKMMIVLRVGPATSLPSQGADSHKHLLSTGEEEVHLLTGLAAKVGTFYAPVVLSTANLMAIVIVWEAIFTSVLTPERKTRNSSKLAQPPDAGDPISLRLLTLCAINPTPPRRRALRLTS